MKNRDDESDLTAAELASSISASAGPIKITAIGHDAERVGPHVDLMIQGRNADRAEIQIALLHLDMSNTVILLGQLAVAAGDAFNLPEPPGAESFRA